MLSFMTAGQLTPVFLREVWIQPPEFLLKKEEGNRISIQYWIKWDKILDGHFLWNGTINTILGRLLSSHQRPQNKLYTVLGILHPEVWVDIYLFYLSHRPNSGYKSEPDLSNNAIPIMLPIWIGKLKVVGKILFLVDQVNILSNNWKIIGFLFGIHSHWRALNFLTRSLLWLRWEERFQL